VLIDKIDAHKYKAEFNSRFKNFCHKAPLLMSFAIEESEVKIIDESTSMVYAFQWDLTMPVKTFIFHIKNTLIENGCYPIIIKTTRTYQDPTPAMIAEEMAEGIPLEETTKKVVLEDRKKYLIDKVVIFKDYFILRDLETQELFRYKLERRSVVFLRKLRVNKISAEEAGEFFFTEAEFLGQLEVKLED
jgi:hypothetical protein